MVVHKVSRNFRTKDRNFRTPGNFRGKNPDPLQREKPKRLSQKAQVKIWAGDNPDLLESRRIYVAPRSTNWILTFFKYYVQPYFKINFMQLNGSLCAIRLVWKQHF